jgi:flavodoxin
MLVAFFTRSGNTQVIAGTMHRLLRTELFQIRPARAYPEDYEQTVEQARQERDRGFEPSLEGRVPGFAAFETVYLGFPIWGETTPPVIRSFLKAHDWSGKTLQPFITHGGYGPGNSMEVLRSHAPAARIEVPFVLEADQERRTLNQVKEWLGK